MTNELFLRLYIAGDTLKSRLIISSVKDICFNYCTGDYRIEVLDIKEDPMIAIRDQIVSIPTIKLSSRPEMSYVGDLSSRQKIIDELHRPI
jgi:circadian clock protein KaiB